MFDQSQKSLLGSVFGILHLLKDPKRQAIDPRLKKEDQFLKGGEIAGFCSTEQIDIRCSFNQLILHLTCVFLFRSLNSIRFAFLF